jgi:hypothetical protein
VTAVFCVVTNSFPGSSLAAAAACCLGGFHVKWDILCSSEANVLWLLIQGQETLLFSVLAVSSSRIVLSLIPYFLLERMGVEWEH